MIDHSPSVFESGAACTWGGYVMANPWAKFFWQDYSNDPALRLCSLAAQGLWMRLLCIAANHVPTGYVAINGKPLDDTAVARLTGASASEVASLFVELEQAGVFSRDAKGRIYSRRMVRDARRNALAKKNGKLGGNPTLCNQKEKTQTLKGSDKSPLKTHKPEAISQNVFPLVQTLEITHQRKNTTKEKTKRKADFELPDWLPLDEWRGWLEMRRKKGKAATDRAKALAISKLEELRRQGHDPGKLLDLATLNSWTGIYPGRSNESTTQRGRIQL